MQSSVGNPSTVRSESVATPQETLPREATLHFIPRPIYDILLLVQVSTVHDLKFSLGTAIVLFCGLDHRWRCVDAQHGSHGR